ncbi:MAG: PQQ-dependent sugar dehydrogenase [Wenzhouxiangella sp.]
MQKRPFFPILPFAILLLLSSSVWGALPDDVEIVNVHPTNTFPQILDYVQAPDGTNRFFAVRQSGKVDVVEDGNIAATPFVNIGSLITTSGTEQGLLGLAFHPDFATNGLFYLNYTAAGSGDTIVAEFSVSAANPNVANPEPDRIIIRIHQDYANHNGGNIKFGPDGFLYIGMGDGGGGGDLCNRAQTLHPDDLETGPASCPDTPPDSAALLGKMLRLDVDNTTPAGSNNLCGAAGDGSANYGIPNDNPFIGDASACGEIWSYGLRNPWRFSFDQATGDLWIADVGAQHWEEVNFEPASDDGGRNYGWRICEASYLTGTSTPCNLTGSTLPVLEYSISGTSECAITGGYRYRGPVDSLQGLYLFADFCTRQLFVASDEGGWDFVPDQIIGSNTAGVVGSGISSFGEDRDGNVYVMQRSGEVWMFQGETGVIFRDRFEAGN